jgi:hypothetical protein
MEGIKIHLEDILGVDIAGVDRPGVQIGHSRNTRCGYNWCGWTLRG